MLRYKVGFLELPLRRVPVGISTGFASAQRHVSKRITKIAFAGEAAHGMRYGLDTVGIRKKCGRHV